MPDGIGFDLSSLSPEVIIFGGLTLVSLSLVVLVWRISIRYGNHMTDTMKMNTEAWVANAKATQKHTDSIDNFKESIEQLSTVISGSFNKKTKRK